MTIVIDVSRSKINTISLAFQQIIDQCCHIHDVNHSIVVHITIMIFDVFQYNHQAFQCIDLAIRTKLIAMCTICEPITICTTGNNALDLSDRQVRIGLQP